MRREISADELDRLKRGQLTNGLEHLDLVVNVEPIAAFHFYRGDAVGQHPPKPRERELHELVQARFPNRGDGPVNPPTRFRDLEIALPPTAHRKLVLARPRENEMRMRIDEPRNDRTPTRIDSFTPARR